MTQRRRTSEGPTEDDAAEQQPVAGPTENAAPPSAERSARRQVSNSATNHDAEVEPQVREARNVESSTYYFYYYYYYYTIGTGDNTGRSQSRTFCKRCGTVLFVTLACVTPCIRECRNDDKLLKKSHGSTMQKRLLRMCRQIP
ncbi:uncharacterized protein DFL_003065 [Arthrobotrys flagrans]|uniref:Uncharacterized protein n=1 Tax=Arthrobotrys flagrans TaxID=97331 RepID=A0A437ACR3_ARTFL|nr:hypothetical protein DFL_003065 [Arthrobotrys flagrans]